MRKNKLIRVIYILIICLIVFISSIMISGSLYNPIYIFNIILHKIFGVDLLEGVSNGMVSIIWNVRIPRVLLCFMVGGMLSVSGVITQSLLRNPLASSYTLGISSGASLGMGILTIMGVSSSLLGYFIYPLVGFVCSILTINCLIFVCKKIDRNISNTTIILMGMVLSLFLNAILTIIVSLNHESLSSILIWQMGSFSSRGWKYVFSIIPFMIIGVSGALFYSREMDVLTFGDEISKSVGVNIYKVKISMLIFSCILTGASIACSGVIGFVDLIVPHIARKIFDSRHTIVIPISFIIGGTLMMVFDLISRIIIYPAEIPISSINALIGVPIFCYIFFKGYRGE